MVPRKYTTIFTLKLPRGREIWSQNITAEDALDAVTKGVERMPKRLVTLPIIKIECEVK